MTERQRSAIRYSWASEIWRADVVSAVFCSGYDEPWAPVTKRGCVAFASLKKAASTNKLDVHRLGSLSGWLISYGTSTEY
jgi:hypothetical protein